MKTFVHVVNATFFPIDEFDLPSKTNAAPSQAKMYV